MDAAMKLSIWRGLTSSGEAFQTKMGSLSSMCSGGLMRRKYAALLMGLLALGGCAGVRYPDYYTLTLPKPLAASRGAAPISGTVLVREFREPEYLREGPIVYRPTPEQIAFYDYHHWGEDPGKTVTAAIVGELQQLFESAALYDGRTGADFLLTGSLDHLEEVDSEHSVTVEVAISAKLEDVKTGDVIWAGSSSKTSKVEQRSVVGLVAEMSRDMSEAATELVSSLESRVSQRSAARRQ
jgi:ABC-type uncharacterized transport system auxiliary subunit